MISWKDIPQFPHSAYEINVSWGYLERHIAQEVAEGLDLSPDFQRAHVWTREQQVRYVEYQLQGGEVGKNVTLNHTQWGSGKSGIYTLVDGKQRVEAVRAFLRGDFRIFAGSDPAGAGWLVSDFEGKLPFYQYSFLWRVCALPNRAELLRLYLNINAGGTPHSPQEIDRVRALLAAEKS